MIKVVGCMYRYQTIHNYVYVGKYLNKIDMSKWCLKTLEKSLFTTKKHSTRTIDIVLSTFYDCILLGREPAMVYSVVRLFIRCGILDFSFCYVH